MGPAHASSGSHTQPSTVFTALSKSIGPLLPQRGLQLSEHSSGATGHPSCCPYNSITACQHGSSWSRQLVCGSIPGPLPMPPALYPIHFPKLERPHCRLVPTYCPIPKSQHRRLLAPNSQRYAQPSPQPKLTPFAARIRLHNKERVHPNRTDPSSSHPSTNSPAFDPCPRTEGGACTTYICCHPPCHTTEGGGPTFSTEARSTNCGYHQATTYHSLRHSRSSPHPRPGTSTDTPLGPQCSLPCPLFSPSRFPPQVRPLHCRPRHNTHCREASIAAKATLWPQGRHMVALQRQRMGPPFRIWHRQGPAHCRVNYPHRHHLLHTQSRCTIRPTRLLGKLRLQYSSSEKRNTPCPHDGWRRPT
jgi:hypothetical protein